MCGLAMQGGTIHQPPIDPRRANPHATGQYYFVQGFPLGLCPPLQRGKGLSDGAAVQVVLTVQLPGDIIVLVLVCVRAEMLQMLYRRHSVK